MNGDERLALRVFPYRFVIFASSARKTKILARLIFSAVSVRKTFDDSCRPCSLSNSSRTHETVDGNDAVESRFVMFMNCAIDCNKFPANSILSV